jgi:hypothetical protein
LQKYKFEQFLERYNNDVPEMKLFLVLEELPKLSEEGPWLAGGAIRRTLIGDPLSSDYDFFFKSPEQLNEFRKKIEASKGRKTASTEHHETYIVEGVEGNYIVQLIKIGFYKNVESLLDSFDFTISQFAYDGESLYCGGYSLWDLARRRLALHKLTYGVATTRRLLKYTNQGFTACTGVIQSILTAVIEQPNTVHAEIEYVD